MTVNGCDSATEPTLAQAKAAKAQGISFWGFYISGPGAYHNWSTAGTTALKDAGVSPLPIYVPAMSNGRISSTTPAADAQAFVKAYQARGINGAGALDTEASMRGFPETGPYTEAFCAELRALGQKDICYAGGFLMSGPPTCTYKWWIGLGTDPGADECIQQGSGVIDGVTVDFDYAGAGFPFASWPPATSYPKPETTVTALLVESNGDLRVTCPFCGHTYDVES